MIEIDITMQAGDWPKDAQGHVSSVISSALSHMNADGEVSIVLADNDFVQTLNRDYRGKDRPTNVLSFPQDAPLLGDIILALETLEREANEQSKAFNDHFTHLLVHGLLHLLGHDHIEEAEAEVMEALEIEILDALGIKNPYEIADFEI